MIPPGGMVGHAGVATGLAPVDLPPMGPRDRPSPLPDGAPCTACGAPVPAGRIRLLASRDGLAFVRLVCDDCGSAAIGLLLDGADDDDGPSSTSRSMPPTAPSRRPTGSRARTSTPSVAISRPGTATSSAGWTGDHRTR